MKIQNISGVNFNFKYSNTTNNQTTKTKPYAMDSVSFSARYTPEERAAKEYFDTLKEISAVNSQKRREITDEVHAFQEKNKPSKILIAKIIDSDGDIAWMLADKEDKNKYARYIVDNGSISDDNANSVMWREILKNIRDKFYSLHPQEQYDRVQAAYQKDKTHKNQELSRLHMLYKIKQDAYEEHQQRIQTINIKAIQKKEPYTTKLKRMTASKTPSQLEKFNSLVLAYATSRNQGYFKKYLEFKNAAIAKSGKDELAMTPEEYSAIIKQAHESLMKFIANEI